MKKRTFIATIAVALIAVVSVFVACTKEDKTNLEHSIFNKTLPTSIPYFDDLDAVDLVLNTVMTFDTISDLIAYENAQGRQSIGAISDYFVEHIDMTAFTNTETALDFCYQNSNLLDITITEDDTSVTPKFFKTPFRYLANSDGYFAIGDKVYRLFDEGIVMTDADNYNYLSSLNVTGDFDNPDTTIFFFSKYNLNEQAQNSHTQCRKYLGYINTKTDGNDRVNLSLVTNLNEYTYEGKVYETEIYVTAQHKFLGIWWTSRRTLTVHGQVNVHMINDDDSWFNAIGNINETQKCTYLYRTVLREPAGIEPTPCGYHYYSFDIVAYSLNVYYAALNSGSFYEF